METKTILSEKFTLQSRDFVKGLIMAILAAVLTFLYELVQDGGFDAIDYATVGKVAFSAALSYILKNWIIEPPQVITIADSNHTAKVAETIIKDKIG